MSSETSSFIDNMKNIDVERQAVEQIRKDFTETVKQFKLPSDLVIESTTVANLPAEWVKVSNVPDDKEQMILYFHGNGFIAGTCEDYRYLASLISRACGMRVLVLGYRLAPEHKYPAANDDCVAAYRWLIKNGISPKNIVIGGESTGGTLTLMTLLSLRDSGDPLPAAAFVLSPVGDYINYDGESYISRAKLDPWLNKEKIDMCVKYYVPSLNERPPILSPINQNLSGLPSLLIQIGDHEVLLSDSTRLAERATEFGVDVTLEVSNNMWHVFQAFAETVPEAKEAVNNIGKFVQKNINSSQR